MILVGSRGGALVQAVLERAPNLAKLLVLEPDAAAFGAVQALKATDARVAERCTAMGPAELQGARDFVAAYLTLGQFLLGSGLPPGALTCVIHLKTAEAQPGRTLLRAATDLTRGFSSEFLRLVAGRPEFASVLQGIAQYLALKGDHYQALKFYSSVAPQKMNAQLVQGAFGCLLALGNAAASVIASSPTVTASRHTRSMRKLSSASVPCMSAHSKTSSRALTVAKSSVLPSRSRTSRRGMCSVCVPSPSPKFASGTPKRVPSPLTK